MPFWVLGSGNLTDAAGHWAAISGGAPGAGNLPTTATDAIFDANSGANATITADATFSCRDFDMSLCAATPVLTGAATINCSGNFKHRVAGMTNSYNGTLTFNGSSGTKLFAHSGVSWSGAAVIFTLNCAGATVQLQDAWSMTGGPSFTSVAGTFDSNGFTTTVSGNSTAIFRNGAQSFTFGQFVRSNSAGNLLGTIDFRRDTTFGALTIQGANEVSRIRVFSDITGTARNITVTGLAPTLANVNFRDINAVGGSPVAPWVGTSLGDCQGCSNITFDAATTCSFPGTASVTWSTAGWTPRVPLPQDNVTIANAFIAGRTITADMPDAGKNITYSCTGNPALAISAVMSVYGNYQLAAGMTNTGSGYIFRGRTACTITTNGVLLNNGNITTDFPGGSMKQLDPLSATNALFVTMGTWDFNGYATSLFQIQATNTNTKGIVSTAGTPFTITLTGPNSTLAINSTGTTLNLVDATLKVTNNSVTTRVIGGGGMTGYGSLWIADAGTGTSQMTGSNTFQGTITVDSGRTLNFTAGTTITATNWSLNGAIIGSITAANHTVAKAGGGRVQAVGATVSRSTASPADTFYDVGGVNGGNNINWTFGAFAVLDPISFSYSLVAATLLASRTIVCSPIAFGYTLGDITLRDFPTDPLYTVGGSRDRAVYGSRNRSISGGGRRSIYK